MSYKLILVDRNRKKLKSWTISTVEDFDVDNPNAKPKYNGYMTREGWESGTVSDLGIDDEIRAEIAEREGWL